MRLSPAKIDAFVRQGRIKLDDIAPALKKPNKYGAIPTADSTGRVHPSKLQARVAERLAGEGVVLHEVSIPLSTRKADRIRIDALVILETFADGTFRGQWVEAKGKDLGEGKQKRRRFEDMTGCKMRVETK